MGSATGCLDEGSASHPGLVQLRDTFSVMMKLPFEHCFSRVRTRGCCAGGGDADVQGRAAPGDGGGSKDVGWPGQGIAETLGFGRNGGICCLGALHKGPRNGVMPSSGFTFGAGLAMLELSNMEQGTEQGMERLWHVVPPYNSIL